MTKEEQKKLTEGLRQSTNDARTYYDNSGNSMTRVSENRTIINGKTVYGSSAAEKEKNKWNS